VRKIQRDDIESSPTVSNELRARCKNKKHLVFCMPNGDGLFWGNQQIHITKSFKAYFLTGLSLLGIKEWAKVIN